MVTSDGMLTTNSKKNSMEMVTFYSDLYAGNDEEVDESHPFLLRPETPKHTSEMNICEGKLRNVLIAFSRSKIISPLVMMVLVLNFIKRFGTP